MYRIAVCYIGIGNYFSFFSDFYTSSEKFFLPNCKKHYFVFTDRENTNSSNISFYRVNDFGWPGNSLYRYKLMLSIKTELQDYDYIFFFNANCLFVDFVSESILPLSKEIVVAHFNYLLIKTNNPNRFMYDRNIKSQAFVPYFSGKVYVQGGLFGAGYNKFIDLIQTCSDWVEADIEKQIIARVADESYLNKYVVINPNIKLLDASYLCPLEFVNSLNPRIILRDKSIIGADQSKNITYLSQLKFKIYKTLKLELVKIIWHKLNGWC